MKKQPNRTRPESVMVRLSEAERARLDAAARAAYLPLSTWLRKVALEITAKKGRAA